MCPEAHTFCKDVVASITKRTGLLRQKEVGSFLWSVGKGGGRRPQWLETSVRWRIGELRRIPLPRLSEKGRKSLQCSLTEHRNGSFRPILASLRFPNPRSEYRSYPFSDSLSTHPGE